MRQLSPLVLYGEAILRHRKLYYEIYHKQNFYSLTKESNYGHYRFSVLTLRKLSPTGKWNLVTEYVMTDGGPLGRGFTAFHIFDDSQHITKTIVL